MNLSLSSMNHVMGHFYSETQFGKDLELNIVRVWVLHSVSLPKPASSLFMKEHLLQLVGTRECPTVSTGVTLRDTFAPRDSAARSSAATSPHPVSLRRPADIMLCTHTRGPHRSVCAPTPTSLLLAM